MNTINEAVIYYFTYFYPHNRYVNELKTLLANDHYKNTCHLSSFCTRITFYLLHCVAVNKAL